MSFSSATKIKTGARLQKPSSGENSRQNQQGSTVRPVTEKQLKWADLVVVMEDNQRSKIGRRFPKVYMQKRIISLEIPNVYKYEQPELIDALNSRMRGLA